MHPETSETKSSGRGWGIGFGIVVLLIVIAVIRNSVSCNPERECGILLNDNSWTTYVCDNPPPVVQRSKYYWMTTQNR